MEEFYATLLAQTQLAVQPTEFGAGLFTRASAQRGEQLLEDVPLFSYPLPLRHFAHYQTRGATQPFCFSCLRLINTEAEQVVLCPHQNSLCLHIYCSEECRDRNWLGGHWLTCLDWNRPCYALIQDLSSDKNTWSDLAVAELLAGFVAKTVLLMVNGVAFEEAAERVFRPFHHLFGMRKPDLYKVNLAQHFRRIQLLFNSARSKLNLIQDQIPEEILQTFVNPDVHGFLMSLVAFNSMEINGMGVGVYSVLSKLNHSCEPNCNVVFSGTNTALLEVERDVQPGDELTISYVDDTLDRETRRRELTEGWGFVCSCPKCQRGE